MKKLMIGFLIFASAPSAFAQDCSGDFRCGTEQWEKPSRAAEPIQQPFVTERVMGSCGEYLPMNQSFQARLGGVTCGSGSTTYKREPLPVSKEVMNEWSVLARSGIAKAQEDMQKIRTQEQKFTGQISIPMQEHWTYDVMVGDYSDRCGSEAYTTTCYKHREEQYLYTWTTDVCTRYEDYDDSPPPPAYVPPMPSSRPNPGYTPSPRPSEPPKPTYQSPYSGGTQRDTGRSRGEDRGSLRDDFRSSRPSPSPSPSRPSSSSGSSSSSRPSGSSSSGGSRSGSSSGGRRSDLEQEYKNPNLIIQVNMDRSPAARRCVSWGKENHSERRWRPTGRMAYSCVKQRAKWCTWLTTASASRACKPHAVKYAVNYEQHPQWKPGFVDTKDAEHRSYIDVLPNRWDLLLGESEVINLNIGGSSTLTASLAFKNGAEDHDQPWNEYTFQSSPQAVRCAYNMDPQFNLGVITHGRILQAAPNPLRVPKDALKFNLDANNRPDYLVLNDGGRGTRLKAAQNARNLGLNKGAENLYRDGEKEQAGMSASGGYWDETRFKIQMFRKDAKGREVRITVKPESYSYDQVDVFGDSITISLEGKDGTDRFYRPGGPMEFIFGRIYKAFNVELTPGQEYFIRVRVVARGLPFYESGCTGGKAVCKGEDGTDEAYSDPIDVPFTADPSVDNRSWFKKFKDWQERRLWL